MMVRVDSERVPGDHDILHLEVDGEPTRLVLRPDEVAMIGRDPGCQLVIHDRSVSRRHAEIVQVNGAWVLRDLGSRNGIHQAGERTDAVLVNGSAEVRIGSPHDGPLLKITVPSPRTAPGPPPEAPPPPPAPRAQAASLAVPPSPPAPQAQVTRPAVPPSPPAPRAPAAGPAPPSAPPAPHAPASGPAAPPFPPETRAPAVGPAAAGPAAPPLPAPAAPGQRPEIASFDASGTTTIGRSASCDIVVPDLLISRRHAEVRQVGAGYQLVDLGSTNGTYLNGRRVDRAMLSPGDKVSVGHFELIFDGRRLHEQVDAGPVSLAAERVTVEIDKNRIVDDVSFSLEQGSLLGIIGPSGCGKSTLVRALTGLLQASAGRISYDGRDLYADYAELRYRIGMVPQDDVLHRQLKVRRALRFAASLRFADDVSRQERAARVEEVLATLDLTDSANNRIDRLSGGQRKRVSVALELLTEPSMLCLDEPTSGLDPNLDREVMQELRGLADRGRTVLCVTHSVLHLDGCDRVMVVCSGGATGYFGPPGEVLDFFEAEEYADVFAKVTDDPEHWARRYRESDLHRRYVADPIAAARTAPPAEPEPEPAAPTASPPAGPAGQPDPANGWSQTEPAGGGWSQPGPAGDGRSQPGPAGGGWSLPGGLPVPAPIAKVLRLARPSIATRAKDPVAPLRQFTTLSLRMFAVIFADRGYFLFLLGLPLVLALLSHTVPGQAGLGATVGATSDERMEAMRILTVLIVGAAFLGISSSIREIVNEATIYKRERAVGLNPGAYLASKFVVLGIINIIQVSLFVWLSLLGRGGPAEALVLGAPMLEIIVPVAMVTTSCTMLGLCISALARSVAQTTPALVVLVMAMLIFTGALFDLSAQAGLNQISWLWPTRWGFAAGAATVDVLPMVSVIFDDSLWTHSAGSWWRAILLLALQITLLTVAARFAMRRIEPGRS